MPRSPLIEEETRSFALFGQQNVKVMRREMQMHGYYFKNFVENFTICWIF